MDQPARQQVRLILVDANDRLRRAVNDRLGARQDSFRDTVRDTVRSGTVINPAVATSRAQKRIMAAVHAMEDEGSKYITSCVDRVAAVSMDMEAFAMIQEGLEVSFELLAKDLDGIIATASGFGRIDEGARRAGLALSESRTRLWRQLEIHRFSFTVPYKPTVAPDAPQVAASKLKGGKPLAAHWDEMWAAIAVALFNGDLDPKTQADIERAMKEWLAKHDLDVADSTVRSRAQPLWRKLQEPD